MFKKINLFVFNKLSIKNYLLSNYVFNLQFKRLLHVSNFKFSSLNPPTGCGKEKCGCASSSSSSGQEFDKEKELKSLNYKIIQCINLGNFEEGIELSDQYINLVEQFFGKEHPFYCSAINNKAFILKTCGEFNEARVLYEEASEKYKQLYSENSEKYVITMQNLATVYRELKDTTKSLEIFDQIKRIINNNTSLVGPNIIANIYLTAAGNFRVLKSFNECDKLLNMSLNLVTENFGDRNLPIATIHNNMGLSLKDQGLFDQALNHYNLALEIREEFLESSHPDVIAIKHNIGQLYFDKGDKEQAMKYFNYNLESLNKNEGN